MEVVFYVSENKEREITIARAFMRGARKHGHTVKMIASANYDPMNIVGDLAAFIGVKGHSRDIMEGYTAAGKHAVIVDKGYFGGPSGPRSKYMRLSVDCFQPLSYFQQTPRTPARLRMLDVKIEPWQNEGKNPVFIAGSSLKYAQWHRLPSINGQDIATSWAQQVVDTLRNHTKRPITYSPKPSWVNAVPIDGTRFVRPPTSIYEELEDMWALITFGSNAAVDAIIHGVPIFVLGDGIAKPLSLTDLSKIETPYYPSDQQRLQFLADLSFCQFDLRELAKGIAWDIIRERFA